MGCNMCYVWGVMIGHDYNWFTVNTIQSNLHDEHQMSCVGVKMGSLGYDRISYIYGQCLGCLGR